MTNKGLEWMLPFWWNHTNIFTDKTSFSLSLTNSENFKNDLYTGLNTDQMQWLVSHIGYRFIYSVTTPCTGMHALTHTHTFWKQVCRHDWVWRYLPGNTRTS